MRGRKRREASAPAASLLGVDLRTPCVLTGVDGGPLAARRLGELGLRLGSTFMPVQRTAGGGRVIAAGDLRLALDRATAASMTIRALAPVGRDGGAA